MYKIKLLLRLRLVQYVSVCVTYKDMERIFDEKIELERVKALLIAVAATHGFRAELHPYFIPEDAPVGYCYVEMMWSRYRWKWLYKFFKKDLLAKVTPESNS